MPRSAFAALAPVEIAVLAALTALPAACARPAATAVPAPTALENEHAPAASPEPHPDGGLEPAVAEATARRIMAGVSAARALPITGEVVIEVLDRQAIRAFAKTSLYEHNSPAKLALLGRIEASLGIIGDADAETVILDLLEQAVMGVYDPERKTLMIGAHVTPGMLSMVVGHEIAHGLQDMHFDLKRYQTALDGQSDRESARTFLIEGDAQAAYLAWISGEAGLASIADPVLDAQGDQALAFAGVIDNPILARMLQLPYADGAATVVRLAREHGWAAVDALYDDLPSTSEQMLHLDKLLAREPAVPITTEARPLLDNLPGYRQVWADELGEATLLAMLADVSSVRAARGAAAGWGGDRFLAFDRPTDAAAGRLPLIVGLITWDSIGDAEEFEPLFAAFLAARIPEAHLLERRGAELLFAVQIPDPTARAAIARSGWEAFTVTEPPSGSRGSGELHATEPKR